MTLHTAYSRDMNKTITDLKQQYAAARKAWREAMDARKAAPFGPEWSAAHSRVLDATRTVEEAKSALYTAIAERDAS